MDTEALSPSKHLYPNVQAHVASRLSTRIQALSLTPEGVASRAGLSTSDVGGYVTGSERIPAAALFALTQALDVDPDYVFDIHRAEVLP